MDKQIPTAKKAVIKKTQQRVSRDSEIFKTIIKAIQDKKGERIVYVRTLVSHTSEDEPEGGRAIERVQTGQYL